MFDLVACLQAPAQPKKPTPSYYQKKQPTQKESSSCSSNKKREKRERKRKRGREAEKQRKRKGDISYSPLCRIR